MFLQRSRQRPRLTAVAAILLPALGLTGTAVAQTPVWTEDRKLVAEDGEAGDRFGWAVALDGNTALVGATGVDGADRGAAYLFDTSTGNQLLPLTAEGGTSGLGSAVALNGSVALVGAERGGDAFVFDASTGQQLAEFIPADTGQGQSFLGDSAAIEGNTALIGGRFELSNPALLAGAVYVYDLTDPTQPVQRARLTAEDNLNSSFPFGHDVDIDGNLAIVGQRFGVGDDGTAYLFDLTDSANPVQLARFTASDVGGRDSFGAAVAIDGNVALVGTDDGEAAYLFDLTDPTNPVEMAKLTASDPDQAHDFGVSVALDGDFAVIGAQLSGPRAGSAYLFDITDLSNVVELAKLTASDAETFDRFGHAVAVAGETAIVGAFREFNNDFLGPGKAYVFNVPEPGCAVTFLLAISVGVGFRGHRKRSA